MVRRIIKYGKLLLSKNKYKTKDKCKNKENCYAIAWIKIHFKFTTHNWTNYHTTINFSKCGVPFRNTFIIKPIYNDQNTLMCLMGITYNFSSPPINILPKFSTFDQTLEAIKQLSGVISLTSPSSPFIIKYVSPEWCSLCGYNLTEAVGSTFKIIQGSQIDDKEDASYLKQKICSQMSYF
jgi:hypothetical protein